MGCTLKFIKAARKNVDEICELVQHTIKTIYPQYYPEAAVICQGLSRFAEYITFCQNKPTTGMPRETCQNTAFHRILGREKFMIKILFVCHGNICRSPMCQFVLQDMINKLGLAEQFHIDSRATSTEEAGNPPHRGTVRKMQEMGIPVLPHRATQITWSDYCNADYIIGMDTWNMRNLNRMLKGDPEGKLYKMLTFAGTDRDIADPWYTGNFDETYEDVVEGCEGFLEFLKVRGRI